jgi:ATPase family associated with various cellular activities (AAA)
MAEQISANRTVTPSEAKKSIRKCIKIKRPVFIWGAPGIGKSDIVKQLGDEQNRPVIDVRLSLWEPTDIKGIPYYNSTLNTMCWAPPSELPTDPDSNAILFLDELNSAAPATQAAAYQLILNRRVGTYVLPKGVAIVAAGNRETDKGVTYRMPAPLANRFLHLELKTNFEDWLFWATANNVHEQVVGYISFAKQDLYNFDPKSPSRSFATPRSWSFVSDLLMDEDLDENTLTDLVSGAIGEGLAVKFMAHRKVSKQMPNPEDILTGKITKCSIKEISAMYSLSISMCYELKDADEKNVKNWNNLADNFFRFLMDNFPTELTVMAARIALTGYNLPFDTSKLKNFDEFHDKYGKYIMTAMDQPV